MIEAVAKQIWVPATPEAAFRRFTEELESWWPRDTHSVCGDQGVSVRFESGVGGRIVETHVDGTEHVWGTVEGWEPPQRTTFTWHPGSDPASATRVTVTFSAEGDGTVVCLEHEGWDALGSVASNVRNSYHSGWDPVLSEFTGTWE